ncbi:hypothetical protein, partial [Pseudomonas fluorescens]
CLLANGAARCRTRSSVLPVSVVQASARISKAVIPSCAKKPTVYALSSTA